MTADKQQIDQPQNSQVGHPPIVIEHTRALSNASALGLIEPAAEHERHYHLEADRFIDCVATHLRLQRPRLLYSGLIELLSAWIMRKSQQARVLQLSF